MNPRYSLVALRAGHRCEYCHAPEVVFNSPFEVEHILPTSLQGTDAELNPALACRSCNLHKSAHVSGIDPQSGEEARLFHPRVDHWDHYFAVDLETAYVEGLSAIGRASAVRLELNASAQCIARRQWIRLGIFP